MADGPVPLFAVVVREDDEPFAKGMERKWAVREVRGDGTIRTEDVLLNVSKRLDHLHDTWHKYGRYTYIQLYWTSSE